MKAVILAAGQGVRLRPLTFSLPKCLVEVRGKSFLQNQLEILEKAGLKECVVVLGYYGDLVVKRFGAQFGSMMLTYVQNKRYYETNNLYSLWMARDEIDDEILLIESDLIFRYELIEGVLKTGHPNIAVTDAFSDGMDGTVVFENNGIINSMVLKANQSKKFDYSYARKTVNIYRFDHNVVSNMLIPNLDKFVQLGRVNEFYESVLADLVTSKKLVLCSHEVGNQPWFEIDNLQDLERAESLFDFLDGSTESQVVKF